MALLFERTQECCPKQLDTADIVRDAIFHQVRGTKAGFPLFLLLLLGWKSSIEPEVHVALFSLSSVRAIALGFPGT